MLILRGKIHPTLGEGSACEARARSSMIQAARATIAECTDHCIHPRDAQILESDVNNYHKRHFLESWHSTLDCAAINERKPLPRPSRLLAVDLKSIKRQQARCCNIKRTAIKKSVKKNDWSDYKRVYYKRKQGIWKTLRKNAIRICR